MEDTVSNLTSSLLFLHAVIVFFTIQALKRNVKLSEKTGRPKSWRFNEETIMPVLDVI